MINSISAAPRAQVRANTPNFKGKRVLSTIDYADKKPGYLFTRVLLPVAAIIAPIILATYTCQSQVNARNAEEAKKACTGVISEQAFDKACEEKINDNKNHCLNGVQATCKAVKQNQ